MSSSFYEDASLVMIPSGYKTSKVYSAKPTDGAGDLSFTRSNDTATRVNSAGLIEKVRTNLLTYSNTFSNAAWVNASSTETGGQSGYDGTSNAWLLDASSAGGFISQNLSIAGLVTFSIYAKAGSQIGVTLYSSHAFQGRYFNLSTGALGGTFVAAPLDSKIESIGSGWYRCSITVSATATNDFRVYVSNGTANVAGNILIQAAQAEAGDIMTDYIATTSAAVSVGPVANVPRLDYLGSSCPRLLLEPQRTNLLTYSEQINNAAWTKGNSPTITTNIATAPDGYSGADGIQDTTGGSYKTIGQNISLSANSTLTFSFFVKKETSETAFGGFSMYFYGGTTKIVYGIVNAVTGTVTYTASTLTPTTKVEDYGTYWRIASTATDNGSNTSCSIEYYAALSSNGTSLSTGIGSVRTVWGFQAEAASYATSYIPTLGAAVTRGSDNNVQVNPSTLVGATTGSWFIDVADYYFNLTGTLVGSTYIGDNDTNFIGFTAVAAGSLIFTKRESATSTTIYTTTNRTAKVCFTWNGSSLKLFVDGVKVYDNNSFANFAAWDIFTLNNATREASYKLNQTLLFPTQLSDADAIALTA